MHLFMAATLAVTLLGVPKEVTGQQADQPAELLLNIARTFGSYFGDYMQSRNGEGSRGCTLGGRDYAEGAWVPVGGQRRCRCQAGIVRNQCRGAPRVAQPPGTPAGGPAVPPSFSVGLAFGTSSKGEQKKNVTPNYQSKSNAVSFKRPIVTIQNGQLVETPPQTVTSRRREHSGKGKAKLFRLFPEVHQPVVRTSNTTGCTVGGDFYPYPTVTSAMSACRCTDQGMLWCWRLGVPKCLGCMVAGQFLDTGASYTLVGGRSCTCQCSRKMEPTCLGGKVLRIDGQV